MHSGAAEKILQLHESMTPALISRLSDAFQFPDAVNPPYDGPVPEGPGPGATLDRPGQPQGRRGRSRDPQGTRRYPGGFFFDRTL